LRRQFARNLKRLRKRNNLTQEALAEKLDISVRYLQRLEGRNCPSVGIDKIAELSNALRSKPKDFFED
jgi:transcriptional regulator with XRE-family HTH domain